MVKSTGTLGASAGGFRFGLRPVLRQVELQNRLGRPRRGTGNGFPQVSQLRVSGESCISFAGMGHVRSAQPPFNSG